MTKKSVKRRVNHDFNAETSMRPIISVTFFNKDGTEQILLANVGDIVTVTNEGIKVKRP